jgi:hypothetical protein
MMTMTALPNSLTAFTLPISLIWEKIEREPAGQAMHCCDETHFYLEIPHVARFLALADKHCIIIEKAHEDVSFEVLSTWLMGTVMAYLLQHAGYLVLHGSAVRVHGKAVIFSGESGAGKSTMAQALLKKGHSFITDDLLVMTKNAKGDYCLIPGPAKSKLWDDAMAYFDYDVHDATPVMLRTNKYAIPVEAVHEQLIPVHAFYELHAASENDGFSCEHLNPLDSLKTLMQNAYRYFMLKPLGKLQPFFNDCHGLSNQIIVRKLTRTKRFDKLEQIVNYIESGV